MRPRDARRSRRLGPAAGLLLAAFLAVLAAPAAGAPAAAVPSVPSTSASGPTFTALDVGSSTGCGQTSDGVLVCWNDEGAWDYAEAVTSFSVGHDEFGGDSVCAVTRAAELVCRGPLRDVVPADPGTFDSVSVGRHHLCAVGTTGALACWGDSEWNRAPAAASAGPFTSVTAGEAHTCAVRASGGATCWGDNSSGQAPAGVAGEFTALSAGVWHTCGLLVDGSLRCWGSDDHGIVRTPPGGGHVAVTATRSGACALDGAGHVTCWGGLFGTPAPRDEMVQLGSGPLAVCGVTASGDVRCWGYGDAVAQAPTAPRRTEVSGAAHYAFATSSPFTGNPRPTFAVIEGTLPPGLAADPDGIRGRPTTPGHYVVRVSGTNVLGTATAEIVVTVTPCGDSFDVDADGLSDLPVGTPGKDVAGATDAGAVTVFFRDVDGPYGELGGTEFTQERVGQASTGGDSFGAAVAVGDASGDGCPDLVVGAPGESGGAGQVTVLLASADGVGAGPQVVLRQGAGAAGRAEAGDHFGAALSLRGDVLWVGSPGEDVGSARDAGVVTRIPVNPLRAIGSVQYRQGAGGVPGRSESGDRFGAVLEGGYLVGAPGEDVGRVRDAGAVTVGLTRTVTEDTKDVPGVAEAGDAFGSALARTTPVCVGEEGATWRPVGMTAIGVPGEDVGGRRDAGAVTLLGALCSQVTQGTPDVGGTVESGDRFGAAVAYSRDCRTLVVGSPGEDIGAVGDAGVVTELDVTQERGDDGAGPLRVRVWGSTAVRPGSGSVPGSPQPGAGFGATLATRSDFLGLAVGAPGAIVDGQTAGAVWAVHFAPWEILSQATAGVSGTATAGDRLGASLPG